MNNQAQQNNFNFLARFVATNIDSKFVDEWLLDTTEDYRELNKVLRHHDSIPCYGLEPLEIRELVEG